LFEVYLMVPGAGRDQEVRGRHGDAGRASPTREFVSATPNVLVDVQFRQDPLKIAQNFFFTVTPSAVPEFQPHHRTPASLTRFERALHPFPHRAVSSGAKKVDPRRGVDQDQSL
jgi:hypothetical protein